MPATAPLLTPPGPVGRSAPSRGVGWCVLAALGLHAALGLGLFLRTQTQVPGHNAGASTAMHVRWATSAPTRVAARSVVPPMSDAATPADTAEAPTASAPPTPAADTPLPDATSDASATPATSADSDAPFTGYARRDMLDRPPQALGIVQIGYPPGVAPGRVLTGRLTLFIDEAGAVRKVMVATPANAQEALPAPFVEAAREAFLQARFAPGERQGVAVKSRIDVEVSFDGREADPVETAQQPHAPAGTDRAV